MKTNYLLTLLISSALAVSSLHAQDEKEDAVKGPGGGPGMEKGKGKGGAGKGGPGAGGVMKFMPVLAALDADEDGTISAEELENATAALKTLDKNGDGALTEEEVRPSFGGGSSGPGSKGGGPGESKGKGKGGKGSPSDDSKGAVVPKKPPVENE